MKLNGFSVTIAEGRETVDGYVHMRHGTQYTILLQNESNRRCDRSHDIFGLRSHCHCLSRVRSAILNNYGSETCTLID